MQLFLFQVKHLVHTVYFTLYRRLKIKSKDYVQFLKKFDNIFVSQYIPLSVYGNEHEVHTIPLRPHLVLQGGNYLNYYRGASENRQFRQLA